MKNPLKNGKLTKVKFLIIALCLGYGLFLISCAEKAEPQDETLNTESVISNDSENESEKALNSEEVEVMPEFPGGEKELMNFIVKNVKYPETAKENGIQGKVYVQFMIDKTGKPMNAKVMQGVDPVLDQEALRVVNLMPVWKPGTTKGEPVNVNFTIPISFKLQ